VYYYKNTYEKDSAMMTLKLTAIGASTGVIIPKEMLARTNVTKGDQFFAVEAPDGGYRLTPTIQPSARKWKRPRTSCGAIATRCMFWRNDRSGAGLD
jgi:antitoxin component of MazEF toxin-antitoxin module